MRSRKLISVVAIGAAFFGPLAAAVSASAQSTTHQFHLSGETSLVSGQTEHLRGHLPGHDRTFWLQEYKASARTWVNLTRAKSDRNGNISLNRKQVGAAQHLLRLYSAKAGNAAAGHTNTLTVTVRLASSIKVAAPTTVTKNASAKVTGAIAPAAAGRTVYLQSLVGGRWVSSTHKAVTGKGGAFSLALFTGTVGAGSWRVYAPQTSAATAAASAAFKLTVKAAPVTPPPVVAASAIALAQNSVSVVRGAATHLSAVVTPAAAGRTVTLQKQSGISWADAATAQTTAGGQVQFALASDTVGSAHYRLVVVATANASAATSGEFSLTVTAPEAPVLQDTTITLADDVTVSAEVDTAASIEGVVTPSGPDGRQVTLSRLEDGDWHEIESSQLLTDEDGHFALTVPTQTVGEQTLRVDVAASDNAKAAVSAPFTFTVTEAPAPEVATSTLTASDWAVGQDGILHVNGQVSPHDEVRWVGLQRFVDGGWQYLTSAAASTEDGTTSLSMGTELLADGDLVRLNVDPTDTASDAVSDPWTVTGLTAESTLTASGWVVGADDLLHVDGTLSPYSQQRVVLMQQLVGENWQDVAARPVSTEDGTWSFAAGTDQLANGAQVRIHVATSGHASAADSAPWTVAGLAPKVTTVSMQFDGLPDGTFLVSGTVTPAEGGREVMMQWLQGGTTWVSATSLLATSANGSYVFSFPNFGAGQVVRVHVPATASATAVDSETFTFPS